MSLLIDIYPQIQPEPEPEGYEFGYYTFNPLLALEVHNLKATTKQSVQDDTSDDHLWKLPIGKDILSKLQQEDCIIYYLILYCVIL